MDYAINITDAILDICKVIAIIVNHISIIHISSLYKIKRNYPFVPYMKLNLIVFIQKSFDCLITIISLLRSFTIVLITFIIRKKGQIAYFPALFDSEHFIKFGSTKSESPKKIEDIDVLQYYYTQRQKKLLWLTISNVYHNALILINCLSIIDIFTCSKNIKVLYFFFYDSLTNHELKYRLIKKKFFCKCFQTTLNLFYDILYFIPINIFLCLTGPWTIPGLKHFFIRINKNRFAKIKENKSSAREDTYYTEVTLLKLKAFNKFNTALKEQIRYYIAQWVIRLKLVFIHYNIFRAYFLWHNHLKPKSKDKQKSFEALIKKHYQIAMMELIFLPYVLIYLILQPWNWYKFQPFFQAKDLQRKLKEFQSLTKLFFIDLITFVILLMLLISVINTKACIWLIIRSLKRNILKDKESIAQYEAHYSNDFKEELIRIFSRNLQKVFSLLLFIIDMILITRAVKLYRRTKPFFIISFREFQMRIKSVFKPKINYSFTLQPISSLSTIYLSSITEYLSPSDILSLSLCSSSINLKYKSNILWKIYFENYYDKKLKESLPPEQYSEFNADRYENYREACKQATLLILSKNRLKSKEIRDRIKGFCKVVEEETIESLIRIPHLILCPIKGLTLMFIYLNNIFYKIMFKVMDSRYFKHPYQMILSNELFDDLKSNSFYTIHLRIYKAAFLLLKIATFDFLFLFVFCNSIGMIIKIICFIPLKNHQELLPLLAKYHALPWWKKMIQNIILIAVFFIPFTFFSIHLYHINEIHIVAKEHLVDKGSFFFSFGLFGKVFDVIWSMRLIAKFRAIYGYYGQHILYALLYYFVLQSISDVLMNSYVYLFKILLKILKELKYLFFPFHFALKVNKEVFLTFNNHPKLLRILLFNIIAWLAVLFPFILCFFVQFTWFKIVVLVTYGIGNMYLIND